MCWSFEVSLVTGVMLVAGGLHLLLRDWRRFFLQDGNDKKLVCLRNTIFTGEKDVMESYAIRSKWYSLMIFNIALVQFSEMVIWIQPKMYEPNGYGEGCPTYNKFGTYGVFLFGYVNWNWLIPLLLWKSSDGGNQRFWIPLIIGVATSVGYMLSLYVAEYLDYYPRQSDSSCSYVQNGSTQHLAWRFKMSMADGLPTNFNWFLNTVVPMVFYRPIFQSVAMWLYGTVSFLIPKYILGWSVSYSMYWWLGMGFCFMFTAEPYFLVYLAKKRWEQYKDKEVSGNAVVPSKLVHEDAELQHQIELAELARAELSAQV